MTINWMKSKTFKDMKVNENLEIRCLEKKKKSDMKSEIFVIFVLVPI